MSLIYTPSSFYDIIYTLCTSREDKSSVKEREPFLFSVLIWSVVKTMAVAAAFTYIYTHALRSLRWLFFMSLRIDTHTHTHLSSREEQQLFNAANVNEIAHLVYLLREPYRARTRLFIIYLYYIYCAHIV